MQLKENAMTLHDVVTTLFLFMIPVFLMMTATEAEQVIRVRVPAKSRRRPF